MTKHKQVKKLLKISAGHQFLDGNLCLGKSTLEEVKEYSRRGDLKLREEWNKHISVFTNMKQKYEDAMETYHSKGKKWNKRLLESIIPMLKRAGDPKQPRNMKDGLIEYYNKIATRPPISFHDYFIINCKVKAPDGADSHHLVLFDRINVNDTDNGTTEGINAFNGTLTNTKLKAKPHNTDAIDTLIFLGVINEVAI